MAGHAHHHEEERLITGKMIIGDVLQVCPQAEEVFKKHLGAGSLAIPGARTEAIEFLCAMNDCHEEPLIKELNQVCMKAPFKTGHF